LDFFPNLVFMSWKRNSTTGTAPGLAIRMRWIGPPRPLTAAIPPMLEVENVNSSAVSGLGGPIQRMRMARPGAVPVVELRFQDMKTKFGKKSKPWLKIVDWVGGKPQEPALKQIEHNQPVRGDMSDEVPF
jgi:hypothetical protein